MSLLSACFTYLIVWWTVLFVTLPWGNRQPDAHETGMAYGAPVNPNLKKKLIATTLISFVLLGVIYACIEVKLIDFRGIAIEMERDIYGGDTANPRS